MFLALPAPFPETLIGHDPAFFFDARARAGANAKTVSIFDPRALAHYHAAYEDPLRIHAMCEDYRAGRTTDLAHDEADRAAGKKIGCPVLALWGTRRPARQMPSSTRSPAGAIGRRICAASPSTAAIICRKKIPTATAKALLEFFGADPCSSLRAERSNPTGAGTGLLRRIALALTISCSRIG